MRTHIRFSRDSSLWRCGGSALSASLYLSRRFALTEPSVVQRHSAEAEPVNLFHLFVGIPVVISSFRTRAKPVFSERINVISCTRSRRFNPSSPSRCSLFTCSRVPECTRFSYASLLFSLRSPLFSLLCPMRKKAGYSVIISF